MARNLNLLRMLAPLVLLAPVASAQNWALELKAGSELVFPHHSVMNTGGSATFEGWFRALQPVSGWTGFIRYLPNHEHKGLDITSDGRISWIYADKPWASGGPCIETNPGIFPMDGSWHHVAFVRQSNSSWQVYLDGQNVHSGGTSGCCGSHCNVMNGGPPTQFKGSENVQLRSFRVSGVARYLGDFSPDDTWLPDGDTAMLIPLEEGAGTTVFDLGTAMQTGTISGDYEWVLLDCNGNGIPDPEDIALDPSLDCDLNGLIDSCEIADDPTLDCDLSGSLDSCDIANDPTLDCDLDGIIDSCEIAADPMLDCQPNGILDTCEIANDPPLDCDSNGAIDSCEIAANPSLDQNNNGVLDSCECGAQNYCAAEPNSTGMAASINWTGALFIDDNFFGLTVADAAPQQFGWFFYGTAQQATPYGEGVICVSGLLFRINPPMITDHAGSLNRVINFPDPPTGWGPGEITLGSTWNFQFWYRDPQGGPAGFNFSDGLEVTFCP